MAADRNLRVLAGVAAGLVTLSVAAPARAGLRIIDFDVTIEGRQHTGWELHHDADGLCDQSRDGTGAETVRFRSRAVRLRALWEPGRTPVLVSRQGVPKVPPAITITRSANIEVGPPSGAACAGGDGTDPAPVAPDCGTRRLRGSIELDFQSRERDLVAVSDVDAPAPFRACAIGSTDQFPTLLPYDDRDRRVGQRIPAKDLFAYGKHIVIARGSRRVRSGDHRSDTDITWTATFTRPRPR